jgi:hypothetical protein
VPFELTEFLADYCPRPTLVVMRRPIKGRPGRFEQLVAEWCRMFDHLEHRWAMPEAGNGAGAAFRRDYDMVAGADLVLAFLTPDGMVGGTAHVVEAAIDRGSPVYSFIVGEESLTRLGEVDPTDSWGPLIEEVFTP